MKLTLHMKLTWAQATSYVFVFTLAAACYSTQHEGFTILDSFKELLLKRTAVMLAEQTATMVRICIKMLEK